MGAPRDGGYQKLDTVSRSQKSLLENLIQQAQQGFSGQGGVAQNPLYQQAVAGTQQFLPGGQGFAPIQAEAQRNFQQQTIPGILNSFGQGAKGSSALNQALASGGANLNSSLASLLAQMQLGASGQAAGLAQLPYQNATNQANIGLNTQSFAYQPKATPFWQDLVLANIQAAGQALGGTH